MSISYGIDALTTTGFFRVNNGQSFGPLEIGGVFYDTGYFAVDGANHANIGVYKSTNGITWTHLDAAHAPSVNWFSEFYPGTGTKIYFAYFLSGGSPPSVKISLAYFDTATGLFTVVNTNGPAVTGTGNNIEPGGSVPQIQLQLTMLSDGTYVVEYANIVTTFWDIFVVTFNGSWGSSQKLNTNAPAQTGYGCYGVGVTSNDKVYCLWLSGDDGFLYSSLLHGGTLDAPVLAAGVNVANNSGGAILWRTQGFYISGIDSLVWSFPVRNFPNYNPKLLVAATASGSASFSLVDPGVTGFNLGGSRGVMAFVPGGTGGTTYSVYYETHEAPGPSPVASFQISVVTTATLSGSWSSPSIVEDYPVPDTLNPAYTLGGFVALEIFMAARLSTGVGFIWGVPALIPGTSGGIGESGTAYALIPLAPPPLLTLVCPTMNTGATGVFFSAFLQASGGFPPYTFALTGGSLPPGLSLNAVTGEISGIPSSSGSFSYTVTVTDSHDQTASVTCEIAISRSIFDPEQTLRWQCAAPGRAGRWFPHLYNDPVVTHYLIEPNAASPNDQELFMLAGGAILKSGGNTDAGADIVVIAEPGSIDNGDERAQKLYVDAMTEADQIGQISSQIRFNNSQQVGPTLLLNPGGPRQQFLENIASLMDLSLYRNISVRYTWTGGPDGPRIYAFEPSGYAQPYLSTFIVTQFINLSFPGWKHHRRLYPALISNANVVFTIMTQDGRSFVTIIPSTGGQFRIIPLLVAHGCKELAFAYQLDGQGTPFALFPESFTVETKEWTEESYIDLAVFRT